LLGVTDEERQARRDQILATSLKDFKDFGEAIACVSGEAGRVVAVTSADKAAQVCSSATVAYVCGCAVVQLCV
jgi:hypothetical protein